MAGRPLPKNGENRATHPKTLCVVFTPQGTIALSLWDACIGMHTSQPKLGFFRRHCLKLKIARNVRTLRVARARTPPPPPPCRLYRFFVVCPSAQPSRPAASPALSPTHPGIDRQLEHGPVITWLRPRRRPAPGVRRPTAPPAYNYHSSHHSSTALFGGQLLLSTLGGRHEACGRPGLRGGPGGRR